MKFVNKMYLLFLMPLLFPITAFAWDYTGHVVIAQIAYNNLTPVAKQKADILANIIYNNLPEYQQNKIDRYYYNASTFAKIAELPDVWRKDNLGTIFSNNGAIPPLSILFYSDVPTRGLHFIDEPYSASSQCDDIKPFNVVWAVNKLESSFKNTQNPHTQAVEMVLEEHYIGDIHQPLHTISRVDNSCLYDGGGNEFCVKWNSSQDHCSKSLHQLWDSAVGYLNLRENVQSIAYALEQIYPESEFNNELKDDNPSDWAKANYQYADFIYSLQVGQGVTPEYYQKGQSIAKKQLALAGYRLANVINSQFSNKD